MTALLVDAAVRHGTFRLRATFEAASGTTVVVGPNGAGKTTLLMAVAGFLRAEEGRVRLGDRVWDDTANGLHVPPEQRRCGFVFQDFRLFPALSVVDNVGFGLRARGASRADAHRQAQKVLSELELAHLAPRGVGGLSGGERQRVALARALAIDPAVLLLDEALSALDAGARVRTRSLLRQVQQGRDRPTLVVTHDPVEAFSLGERIVVVEDGATVWSGRVDDVSSAPASPFLAALRGMNAVSGRLDRHGAETVVVAEGLSLVVGDVELPSGARVLATFPASAVTLASQAPQVSARNVFHGEVADVRVDGGTAHVRLATSPPVTAHVTAAAVDALELRPGANAWAYVKATEVRVDPI